MAFDIHKRPVPFGASCFQISISAISEKQLIILGMILQQPVQTAIPKHILLRIMVGIADTFGNLTRMHASFDKRLGNEMHLVICRIKTKPKIQIVQQPKFFIKADAALVLSLTSKSKVSLINKALSAAFFNSSPANPLVCLILTRASATS